MLKNPDNRTKIIKILNNNLDEEYIEKFCLEHNLSVKVAETTYLYLNNKIEEVSELLNISVSTVSKRIQQFIKFCKKLQ